MVTSKRAGTPKASKVPSGVPATVPPSAGEQSSGKVPAEGVTEPVAQQSVSTPKSESRSDSSGFTSRWSASDAGGAVLALVVWSWVVLPIIQGGPERMRNVLRAKFLNKGPKGEWLS